MRIANDVSAAVEREPPEDGLRPALVAAVADAAFAFDLLAGARARPWRARRPTTFVRGFLKAVTAHEVGHTLGLRHNFHAQHDSYLRAAAGRQAHQPRWDLTNSVMEYIPTNVAAKGAAARRDLPDDARSIRLLGHRVRGTSRSTRRRRKASVPELDKIAARGAEPMLAYATDEDAGFFDQPFEMDPLVNRFDLGSEPLKYYAHRVQSRTRAVAERRRQAPQAGRWIPDPAPELRAGIRKRRLRPVHDVQVPSAASDTTAITWAIRTAGCRSSRSPLPINVPRSNC